MGYVVKRPNLWTSAGKLFEGDDVPALPEDEITCLLSSGAVAKKPGRPKKEKADE